MAALDTDSIIRPNLAATISTFELHMQAEILKLY